MYADINKALMAHLLAMVGVFDVAAENMPYTPVESTPYINASVIHADGRPNTLGTDGFDRYRGIFQLAIYTPKGTGTKLANDQASLIRDQFKRGTSLTSNGTTVNIRKGSLGPTIPDGAWDIRPFSIDFEVYHKNP